jgi:L-rhamnose mutarotase
MSRFFVTAGSARPDEGFVPLREVFHLQDQLVALPRDAGAGAASDPAATEGER